ncbi:hypothetical protein F4553_003294 [Allocatelliglobosispora scoriae]|uniref:PBP domain-containing protein n=1 Tax=Allocatelliglobosispora scoriae TaxID=643052 RepID=A0A841BQE1_9ACTN|nr:hypothetical protein [Allocatelliglobosispora scoriae]MBB5869915.1 hypothetical protein [Allocatelliglobosispora scoriae]
MAVSMLVLALPTAAAVGAIPPPTDPVPADGGPSPLVVRGRGAAADLSITVAQTKNLTNQVVAVSWSGAATTAPGSGLFGVDFIQIMQCWGDAPSGPTREQCQFGGLAGDGRGGPWVASRQVRYGRGLVDPAETITAEYVPFRSVTGKVVAGDRQSNDLFDGNTTNEAPFGLTRADGTGQEFFEMQTGREAPGLGCGEAVVRGGKTVGRPCWLVIVPRGRTEVDGSARSGSNTSRQESSPLSQTNWNNRIVVPLTFLPLGLVCPLGAAERPVMGQEIAAEAVSRWQPSLCQQAGGAIFGYSQTSDDIARARLVTADPGLVFLTRPLPTADVPSARPPVYAPIALTGLTIAFNIDSQSRGDAPPEVKARNGQRINELNLTPRLVAKLITQSYRQAVVDPRATQVANNPSDMTRDPDFKALNPTFANLSLPGIADIVLPIGLSDANGQLWAWLMADEEASAFLTGHPDEWGMRINSNFVIPTPPVDDYPKADLACVILDERLSPLCTLDAYPYADDMHDAARAASRGEPLGHAQSDTEAFPPVWRKNPTQPSGSRQLMALMDAATATRYGMPTAKLRNAAGQFVGPTTAALLAGVEAMRTNPVGGVLEPDPPRRVAAAYPLTTVTYAATAPAALTAKQKRDYATFLRFAAGAGQTPGFSIGQLPLGYAPLPEALRARTRAVASALAGGPSASPGPNGGNGNNGNTSGNQSATPGFSPPFALPSPNLSTESVVVAQTTPDEPVGSIRSIVLWLLVLGGLAACAGPILLRQSGRGEQ